jgi:protein-S-isoprenylcysteine O-methyltransferase Ste14
MKEPCPDLEQASRIMGKAKLILLLSFSMDFCTLMVMWDTIPQTMLWLFVALGCAQLFGLMWIVWEM